MACVYQSCGIVMERMTVQMDQMKWDVGTRLVMPTCLHARMGSASHFIGFVTLIVIALMEVMKVDAVSMIVSCVSE
jgi:hypothetical protein